MNGAADRAPSDLTLPVDGGFLNVRVGVVVENAGAF